MLKLILLLPAVFICSLIEGQNIIKEWDKEWTKKIKGKLKYFRAKEHNLFFFYYKSNKTVFSIHKRNNYKTGKRLDSVTSFTACFKNDTLFRVVVRIEYPKEKESGIIMYLDGDKILAQDVRNKMDIPEIPAIVEKSYQFLSQANKLLKEEKR